MRRRWLLALSSSVWLFACHSSSSSSDAPEGPAPSVCNGHAELCSRRYDQVAFAGTHDAYADTDEKFAFSDQTHPLTQQLQDGIRVLHLEIKPNWPNKDEPYVCHGICAPGKSLVDDLKEVNAFVTAHPNEVVTLLTESDTVTTDDIAQAYEASGILPSVLKSLPLGTTWPTLSELIRRGERVVVFYVDQSNAGGGSYDWMLPRWSWTWETPWDNEKLADFARCDADRGKAGNPIYVVDTYLEDVQAAPPSHSALVNYDPFLVDRVTWCQRSKSRLPNFVMVNFYEVGDVLHVVDVLNGFAPPPAGAGDAPPSAYDPAVDAGTD